MYQSSFEVPNERHPNQEPWLNYKLKISLFNTTLMTADENIASHVIYEYILEPC